MNIGLFSCICHFFRNFTRCFVYQATTKPSMWSKGGFEEELDNDDL